MANKITMKQVAAAYEVAVMAYGGKITVAAGVRELHGRVGLNENSARDFINDYRLMLRGKGCC
jgi:hypothetical protein